MGSRIATVNTVVAVGVGQLTEILIGLHQCLGIFRRIAEVHVIIGQTMTDEQIAR